jgi:predicted NUDIX family NTP pyrophosphohydrolase
MSLSKKVNLIIYRFREKGLEVFLEHLPESDKWGIPQGDLKAEDPAALMDEDRMIALDPVRPEDGEQEEEALAVEGEWHDIPSLKSMLYEDAVFLKEKIKEMEKGAFFVVKEAFKKVLPHQYAFLKELKDILTDRESLKNL